MYGILVDRLHSLERVPFGIERIFVINSAIHHMPQRIIVGSREQIAADYIHECEIQGIDPGECARSIRIEDRYESGESVYYLSDPASRFVHALMPLTNEIADEDDQIIRN
jgi:hypothetical protein